MCNHKTLDLCDKLIRDDEYRNRYDRIQDAEQNRIYCRHDMEHFLNVARLAYIDSIEQQLHIDKELIYLCALLHDMGRADEYEQGISHHEASVAYAGEILLRLGTDKSTIQAVCAAISHHGKRINLQEIDQDEKQWNTTTDKQLAILIARADQMSRNCYICNQKDSCKWNENEKNTNIKR